MMPKFFSENHPRINRGSRKKEVPVGIWSRCAHCNGTVSQNELKKNWWVCPKCDYHYHLSPSGWIDFLCPDFEEWDAKLEPVDPLKFVANKPYKQSLKQAQERTGFSEAVVTGEAALSKHKIALAVMNFDFIGGSMASVVGEKITRAIERATDMRFPLIIISSSGGARMQEGIFSLMQMAKTSAAVGKLHQAKVPFISVLTHPTTGGVAASFAFLADIILAEPRALIGFAGPRVIEQTIREKLPRGFQTAEFLLERGMIDRVVKRPDLKETLVKLLNFLANDHDTKTGKSKKDSWAKKPA